MVQNLRLSNYNLTSTDSNVASDFDITTSQLDQKNSSTWCIKINTTCYNKKSVYARNDNNGSLYNWYTATAGTNSSTYDICPKNWRLPTGGPNGESAALDKAWGGTGTNRANANTYDTFTGDYANGDNGNFTLAGHLIESLDDVDTQGYWWSSTTSDSGRTYYLNLYSNTSFVDPRNSNYWYAGASVRCVASR